ncbi:MAG: gamma-glutamyltransferase [Thermomicrobiales bacterium]|nr:gamma-glutamyltransferase [Thermomicrobiales bacterium]
MSNTTRWQLGRTVVTGRRGVVSSKTIQGSEAGAAILAKGGNAVDAAAATAAVTWVSEPWMNGLGGGGYMVIHRPGASPAVVDYTMIAPKGASPEMFPLAPKSRDKELFGWASVVGGKNVHGPSSVAVPGSLAGIALALERFGTISLAEALEPAIALAEDGAEVNWHWTYMTAYDQAVLARYPDTAAIFLTADGHVPISTDPGNPQILRNPDLAKTLRLIADQGAAAFYEGEPAAKIAAWLNERGSPMTKEDFAAYEAREVEPLVTEFHGHQILATPGPGGGPTLTEGLRLLAGFDLRSLGFGTPESLHLIAEAYKIAFADRFAYFADPTQIDVPFDALLSAGYLDSRRSGIDPERATPARAGDRPALGVTHYLASSIPEYTSGGSTTHFSVIDGDGMAVSNTQTLLSGWGSRVVVPGTGVVLNNGMMWFDPEPGRPNSVGPGKRPVANMSPAVVVKDGEAVTAIGASGGRRIISTIAQLAINVIDHDMEIQAATDAPRIELSTPEVVVSDRFGQATIDALIAKGHPVRTVDETQFGGAFASPANVQRRPDGTLVSGIDAYYFPATAIGVD